MLFSMRTKTGTLAECMVRGMGAPEMGRGRARLPQSRGPPCLGLELAERAALEAHRVEVRRREPALEGRAQSRPLAVQDREPRRVAVAPLHHPRLPERPLVREAESLRGAPRR